MPGVTDWSCSIDGTAVTRTALQTTLTIFGAVALVAGAGTALLGAASIIGAGEVSPTIDSELRFYAAWYAAAGVVLLRAIPRVESEGATIRAVCVVFFVCACARLISIIFVGTPHPVAVTLMVVEFAIAPVVVPWQAAVARGAE